MKKILSLTLAVMMVVSMIPTAFAADVDVQQGTQVTVVGAGGEYTVTVPAKLNAGEVGTVTAKGYWASDETLNVTAPGTIEVTNTETSQKATVNVEFDGIASLGNDLEEMNIPVDISIDASNIKFGTWKGTIVYNVELVTPPAATIILFTIGGTEYQAEEGMSLGDWVDSDYNTDDFVLSGTDRITTADGSKTVFYGGGYDQSVTPGVILKDGDEYTLKEI